MKTIVGVVTSLVLVASGTPQTVSADELSPTLRPLRQVERQPTPSVLQTRRAWFQKLVASIRSTPAGQTRPSQTHSPAPQAGLIMTRRRATQLISAGAMALGLDPQGVLLNLPATETVVVPSQTFAQLSATYLSSAGEELFGILPVLMRQLNAILDAPLLRQQPDRALPMMENYIFKVVKISVGSLDRPPFILPSKQEMGVLRQFFSSEENMRHLQDNPWVRGFQAGRPSSFFPMATEPDHQTKEGINQMFQEWDAAHPVDEETLRKAFHGLRAFFTRFDQEAYQKTFPRVVRELNQLAERHPQFQGIARVMSRFQEAGASAAAEEPWYQAQAQTREASGQASQEPHHRDGEPQRENGSPHLRVALPVLRDHFEADLPLLSAIELHSSQGSLELHLVWQKGQLLDGELVRRTPAPARWSLSPWQRRELEAWWPAEVPRPDSAVMSIPFEPQSDWLAVLHRLRIAMGLVTQGAQPALAAQPRTTDDAL